MSSAIDIIKDNKKILLLAVGILLVSIGGLYLTSQTNFLSTTTMPTTEKLPNYTATITTSMGVIEIDLYEQETPQTVKNFVKLSKEGFYNGLIFHRIIPQFVIQGGDPTGTGMGGPGYKFNDEITNRKFEKYSVAMANSGPNTNGSQFFITTGDIQEANLRFLDGKYTLFGKVTSGFNVVDSISKVDTDANDKPVTSVTMDSITIKES